MGRNNTTSNKTRLKATSAIALATILGLSACAGGNDDSAGDDAATADFGDDAGDTGDTAEAVGDADSPSTGRSDFDFGNIGRDVIVEMRIVMSSDDIQRTVAAITADATTLGGGIASSDVDFGTGEQDGWAVLVVKVPPETVDRMLGGLDDTGTVQSITQSAQDVTEQLVDLDVRIENARESVANVRGFMERAESLTELVTLEAELTRRQTELERLEAQQRNLTDRVALATLTIEVVPTAAVPVEEPEPDGIGDAFAKGWDVFVGVLFGLAFVLAVLAPFLAVLAVLVLAAWLVQRGRRRSHTTPVEHPAPAEQVSDDPASASHSD